MNVHLAPFSPGPRWYVFLDRVPMHVWTDGRAAAADYAAGVEYGHGIAAMVVHCACVADVRAAADCAPKPRHASVTAAYCGRGGRS